MKPALSHRCINTRLKKRLSGPALLSATIGLVAAVTFFALGEAWLVRGHPHEDAFILFRYANNAAAGLGVVFNPTGPPAEGATDFLWLVLLAAGTKIGSTPAEMALLANCVSAGLGAAIVVWVLARGRSIAVTKVVAVVLAPAILLTCAAVPAYGGFSCMLYSVACLVPISIGLTERKGFLWLVPVVSLLLGLLRPDGAILGFGFTAIGCLMARRSGVLRMYLIATAASGAIAVAYFAWRCAYFGLPLPLPLYVKSRGEVPEYGLTGANSPGKLIATYLPGIWENLNWFKALRVYLVLIGFTGVLFGAPVGWRKRLLTVAWLVPFALLLGALSLAHQSQNVAFRFQGPVLLGVWYSVCYLSGEALRSFALWRRALGIGGILAGTIPWTLWGSAEIRRHFREDAFSYIDTYAPILGRELQDADRIVLTEAGRLPYWSRANVIDAVGLNTPRVAMSPLRLSDMNEILPAIVMFHHSDTLELERSIGSSAEAVARVMPCELEGAVVERFRPLFLAPPETYAGLGHDTTDIAALLLARWLSSRDDYVIYAVRYGPQREFEHVYGFRSTWRGCARAIELLQASQLRAQYRGYFGWAAEFGLHSGVGLLPKEAQVGGAR